MTDEKLPRAIVGSDIDVNGNVVIWDHGPDDDEGDAKAWKARNGDGPVPLHMAAGDAAHALAVDPERYSLEPIDGDAEIDAEVKKIQEQREAAKKAAEERVAAIQLAEDRKVAAAVVMAARRAKVEADKVEAKVEPKKPPVRTEPPINPRVF